MATPSPGKPEAAVVPPAAPAAPVTPAVPATPAAPAAVMTPDEIAKLGSGTPVGPAAPRQTTMDYVMLGLVVALLLSMIVPGMNVFFLPVLVFAGVAVFSVINDSKTVNKSPIAVKIFRGVAAVVVGAAVVVVAVFACFWLLLLSFISNMPEPTPGTRGS